MFKRRTVLLAGVLSLLAGCQDFLDVNENPNAPQVIPTNMYLPPMVHWMVTSPQFDGRFIGQYTQQWMVPAASPGDQFDRMNSPLADAPGQMWRDYYWNFGQNLIDMMAQAEAEQRWDMVGIGYVLKAWGWQQLTDTHGEIIVSEAFDRTKYTFKYDSQDFVYQEIQRLLGLAIENLSRTDGAGDPVFTARGDKLYNGDRAKWLKLAQGMKALNLNHYSNKSSYRPADVIAAVDASFASNADDALMTYPGIATDLGDMNFWGASRGNLNTRRQTRFVVGLLDGTQFGTVDPRLSKMLAPDSTGVYRGLDPAVANFGTLTTAQRPWLLYGYPTQADALRKPGKYLFDDKSKIPAMTYAQLQFIKAEAAYRSGNRALALTAYRNAVSAHIDFVNARNQEIGGPAQITAAEKAAFLASPSVVPTDPNLLTLTHIMSQKYIAQWAWAHVELWTDMRRYDYVAVDPASARQVYPGFALPTTNLHPDNLGKPVQRIKPRLNSEYVWNQQGLSAVGGLAIDYHTLPMWITEP